MITLIKVDEGPVDIYELRMRYLAKLKETDGVMLPTFIYRNKDLFVTEFKPTCDDQWIMYMTNSEGLITKMRIKNGDLMSNGSVLFLAEERKTDNAKEIKDLEEIKQALRADAILDVTVSGVPMRLIRVQEIAKGVLFFVFQDEEKNKRYYYNRPAIKLRIVTDSKTGEQKYLLDHIKAMYID